MENYKKGGNALREKWREMYMAYSHLSQMLFLHNNWMRSRKISYCYVYMVLKGAFFLSIRLSCILMHIFIVNKIIQWQNRILLTTTNEFKILSKIILLFIGVLLFVGLNWGCSCKLFELKHGAVTWYIDMGQLFHCTCV